MSNPSNICKDQSEKTAGGIDLNDYGLVCYRRFMDGDDSGLEEIVKFFSQPLMLFINGYVNNINVAEDIMSESFLKLIIKRRRFKGNSTFKTYLFSVGRNLAVDYLRKAASNKTVPLMTDSLSDFVELESVVIVDEQKRKIHSALWKLNDLYREVLYLSFFEDMTNEQVALVLKKSKKQVENLLYRAKQSLKAILEREGITL
ncbi:MAG: RNA polymerase sigma factor [Clostridiales bacterium]|nr:RNA polymerase sigma factor [Clostridiales bacterium]